MSEVFGKNPVTSSQFPVVLFDAGGTLLHFNPSLEKLYRDQLSLAGEGRADDDFDAAHIRSLMRLNRLVEQDESFSVDSQTLFRLILDDFQIDEAKQKEILARTEEAFSSLRIVVAEPVIALCDVLRTRGFRLGIVSNWDHRLTEILRQNGILDLFEVVITAYEFAKPSPQPFLEALDDMECAPKDALHVGASFAIDVIGSQRAGLRSILYDPTYRELKALAETTAESLSKVVSIETLRQNRRLNGVKVITTMADLLDFLV